MGEQLLRLVITGEDIEIFDVYTPTESAQRTELFQQLELYMEGGRKWITVGDFSCMIEKRDREGSRSSKVIDQQKP